MSNVSIKSEIDGRYGGKLLIEGTYDNYGNAQVMFIIDEHPITVSLSDIRDIMDILNQMRERSAIYKFSSKGT